jgi:4-diphosphocytidyl-2-C-methyl-D-erythritol kinase
VAEIYFKLPAFAKINWFLHILGKRDDGYHEISTVFQTVSLHDVLTFSESKEIKLTCSLPQIPTDESNLIVRAALKLKERFGIEKGAQIHLEKRIPSPGGLGGGSSDAAITLLGLAKLWKLEINFEELCKIGAELGSDVPFFFFGGTACGTGRGTEITPIEEIEEKFLLIVTPQIDVPTAEAFGRLNAPRLTNFSPKSILKICRNEAEKRDLRQSDLVNDFEAVVFEIEPEIERVRKRLLETGAGIARMSGSGASVFGIFDNEETRQATLKALENEVSWRKFAVATVSREMYRETLKELFPISF